MNIQYCLIIFIAALAATRTGAQDSLDENAPGTPASRLEAAPAGGYATDLGVVNDAQEQALAQARQMLDQTQNAADRDALDTAIQNMERAHTALARAGKSPDTLPAAIAAEQAAYQALLKATPREFRMTRARRGSQGQGGASGQPDQREAEQLDLEQEQNRYETERQAAAAPNAQQREQTQVADRLKDLAQRQQDLNDRMRELQNALPAAHTDQERADIQRQLKRLDDEQRQMLASVDEMRQQLEQSPNASAEAGARQQLDQTRTDMQHASAALQNQSASQALAAGARAQQNLQNLREDLRRQTASQFSTQMRQMRSQARDLVNQENNIAHGLDALNHDDHPSLDNSAQRQQLIQQMAGQESTLTNLLAGMKDVTEQAETTEPLLAKQLYDTIRRADQMHTDNLLDMGSQLVDRGFLPQAGEVERSARTNITELADRVQRAADSVLGSHADALRYAQQELDELTRQLEREMGGATNAGGLEAGGVGDARGQTNRLAGATRTNGVGTATGGPGTNSPNGSAENTAGRDESLAGNTAPDGSRGDRTAPGENQNGNRGGRPDGQRGPGQPEAAGNSPAGQGETAAGADAGQGQRGNAGQAAAGNAAPGQTPGGTPSPSGEPGQTGDQANTGGAGNNADRLREFTQRLGRARQAGDNGGPITGNDYARWSAQLRDVESVLDSPDLRNQLATVRDRAGAFRGEYRERQRIPSAETIRRQLLVPLGQVRVWVQEELARQANAGSLVPLDHDPVPDNYSTLVSKYYEKLGSAQ